MTKGNVYDQTPLLDLLENAAPLKEDMTTICDEFGINESDLMRKAIVRFVENIKQNPDQTLRHTFV
jgi:hypothetical protein